MIRHLNQITVQAVKHELGKNLPNVVQLCMN